MISLPPCIILCGGLGTRLGRISKKIPKCLVTIHQDKPFLYYQLKYLESKGIDEVILCIGHKGELIVDFLKDFQTSLKIKISEDGKKPLGTGGAVKKVIQELDGCAFVTYGDTFLEISYRDVFEESQKKSTPLMVIYKNNSKYDESNVLLKNNRILYRKQSPYPKSQYIDYGLSIFSSDEFMNSQDAFDLSDIQESLSNKGLLSYYIAKKRFYEIGTPQSLKETRNFLNNYDIQKL